MKKTLLTAFAGLALTIGFSQTTATNWTVNDCASSSHTLFNELDAGKVVVITWVMPCGACIAPAQTASNTVSGMGNPNVVFYLCDDYGTTSCSTINSWAATNNITATKFSNAAIKMTDYGSTGMPKTVVLGGGTCRNVFYNVNGTVSSSALTTAINNALSPCTGVIENNTINMELSVFPNPANSSSKISYSLESSSDVKIELFNLMGEKTKLIFSGNQSAGEHTLDVDCAKLSNGIYFVKLAAGKIEKTIILSVVH